MAALAQIHGCSTKPALGSDRLQRKIPAPQRGDPWEREHLWGHCCVPDTGQRGHLPGCVPTRTELITKTIKNWVHFPPFSRLSTVSANWGMELFSPTDCHRSQL